MEKFYGNQANAGAAGRPLPMPTAAAALAQHEDEARAAYARKVAASAQVEAVRESDKALAHIAGQFAILEEQANRLSLIADRVVGSRLKDASQRQNVPGNPHLVGKLHMIGSAMDELTQSIAESLERLEGAV